MNDFKERPRALFTFGGEEYMGVVTGEEGGQTEQTEEKAMRKKGIRILRKPGTVCVSLWGRLFIYLGTKRLRPVSTPRRAYTDRAAKRSYRRLRVQVAERQEWRCAVCGCSLNHLRFELHHVKPVALYPELAMDGDNCMALCHSCHLAAHTQTLPAMVYLPAENN